MPGKWGSVTGVLRCSVRVQTDDYFLWNTALSSSVLLCFLMWQNALCCLWLSAYTVLQVHREFIHNGADVLQACTFWSARMEEESVEVSSCMQPIKIVDSFKEKCRPFAPNSCTNTLEKFLPVSPSCIIELTVLCEPATVAWLSAILRH